MSNSLNTLIGTFSSIDTNSSVQPIIDVSNLICIDTSNNRIGINTMNPRYSITIMNSTNTTNNTIAISTPRLHITNIARVSNATTNIFTQGSNQFEIYCDQSGYLRML
jgi:hypothetical protein